MKKIVLFFLKIILVLYNTALLKLEVILAKLFIPIKKRPFKILLAVPVGLEGKENVKKYIHEFNTVNCDFLLFCYDETKFEGDGFQNVKIIHEKGRKWGFAYKYLTPEFCAEYDYIFYWDDDLELLNFLRIPLLELVQEF